MSLRIGIVGCGKIADGHADEIRKLPGATLAAVCDLEPLMAEQLATRFQIGGCYNDFSLMLDREQLDVVHITTPPQSHPHLAILAMDAGCHVFVEKPIAINAAGAVQVLDHAVRVGRKVSVNYWYNFEPPALELRRWLAEHRLGDIVHVESHFGYSLAGDYSAALLSDPGHWVHRLPGKLFHNVLDHIVNKITWMLPDDEPEVFVSAFRRRPATGQPVADSVLDELRFFLRGNAITGIGVFTAHAKPLAHLLRVYGTKNTAMLDFQARSLTLLADQTIPSALGRLFPAFVQAREHCRAGSRNLGLFARNRFHYFAGMTHLIKAFYAAITEGAPDPISPAEILRVARIMDAIIADLPSDAGVSA